MRILHTSDWHLGRTFHGNSLQAEQQQMLDRVCAAVSEHQVDVVLVSGDVYDRALPPEWAVAMLEDCLLRLVQHRAQVIITSGNHDSAARLGFGRRLMSGSGVHIRSALADAWTPVMLDDDDGAAVAVYGVPYLEPQLCWKQLGCQRANHTAVMAEVTARVRADVEVRRAETAGELRTVLMAHLFAAKGAATDSERDIGVAASAGEVPEHHEETLGGLTVVPLELFDGIDYVALGHLHGRQQLSESVRYSGAPLAYSFSEAEQAKGAWLWDTRTGEAQALDWQIGREVKRLTGTIDELLAPDLVQRWGEAFVQVKLTDDQRPERAYPRVKEAYPYLATFSYEGASRAQLSTTYSEKVEAAQSDAEVLAGFLQHVRHRVPSAAERDVLAQALEAVRVGPAAQAQAKTAAVRGRGDQEGEV